MIKPMLSKPMSVEGIVTSWSDWAIEEKYDGHRLIIEVGATVTAWSRPRGDDGQMAVRELPAHLVSHLSVLPFGVYDGELLVDLKDATGTDVTRTDSAHLRYIVLFDILKVGNTPVMAMPYLERHARLRLAMQKAEPSWPTHSTSVRLSPMKLVNSEADVKTFVEKVWARGGEGAILKRRDGKYEPGVRSKNSVKVKRVTHATLTVVGFSPSKGTVRFPGHPFAVVQLRDDDGNETTVKALNDFELGKLSAKDIGRKLMIEFPKRTRTGGYQGPVLWDRWAEEGE